MLLIKRKNLMVLGIGAVMLMLALGYGVQSLRSELWVASSSKYRVFVSGIGTVEGVWAEKLGIALIGLQTRPGQEEDRDLKYIDILVANTGDETVHFNPDFTLINKEGDCFVLSAEGQPQVLIKPGEMTQGTVIIDVPKGTKDEDLTLEIKGGCLQTGVLMPLKVSKIKKTENGNQGENSMHKRGNPSED